MFCPRCMTLASEDPSATQTSPHPVPRRTFDWRIWRWAILALIVFIVLIVPVFPKNTIVYVDGTTQSVTSRIQHSTSVQVYTTTTTNTISVYTGTYKYFHNWWGGNYQYFYNWWGANQCYLNNNQLVCNYNAWPWYEATYGTTVIVTSGQQVVGLVRKLQPSGLESLTLIDHNGKATTIQNVYSDDLSQSGTSAFQSSAVVTNTVTGTVTIAVTQTSQCHQCVPEQVTQHVSILQLLLGY